MKMWEVFRMVFGLGCCFTIAGGIKCYQCRTDQDEDCESGSLDDRHLEDCASALRGEGPFFCRSIHQILYFTENHDEAIIRECGSETFKRECYKAGWEDDSYQLSCDCRTDGCNSAHLTAASVTCWLSILVLLYNITCTLGFIYNELLS